MDYLFQNLQWIIPLSILDFSLKGFALWRAGNRKEVGWFIALFFINSAGILPLYYLHAHPKKK